jgi:hydroxymethylbilane synthase
MMRAIKVGTRTSPLALKQTELVVAALKKVQPAIDIEVVGISTKGDRLKSASLTKIGGKGVFVKEVEHQLLTKKIDFAVHSYKDVPAIIPNGLVIAASPLRANPYDCLVLHPAAKLTDQLVIGTSSLRREKQLQRVYPQFSFVPIRGNIETRLQKIETQHLGGTILAAAGMERMNYLQKVPTATLLAPQICVPAVAQGILAVECRKSDRALVHLLRQITDPVTVQAAEAERAYLRAMDGNCEIPIGGFANRLATNQWEFHAFLAKNPADAGRSLHLVGADPLSLAKQAVRELL